jgi:phosphate transport system permease protein
VLEATPRSALRLHADWVATAIVWGVALAVCAAFLWIVLDLLREGLPRLSWSFLVESPRDAGRAGGIAPIVLSTLWILAVCLAVSIPLGTGAALLLAEFSSSEGRFTAAVRRSLDVLAGVPSIVFGLFGNAFFCVALGLGFSILSGGLTLACMALPLLIRATEEGLRSVPDDYRLAAAALGMSRTRTIFRVLLPAASPALAAGVVLGVGRAIAETAALIFTSGYVDRMPGSWLDSGRALSIHIYDLSMNVAGAEANAYASALILLLVLLAINTCVLQLQERWLARREARA